MYDIRAPELCEEEGGTGVLSQDGLSYCFVKRKVVLGSCHKMDCLIALSCPQQLFVWTLFL